MFLSRSLFAFVLMVFSSIFISLPVLAAELDKCHYESPNNILTPSGEFTKDDICNTPYMDQYENLYYYDGPKAFCGDNKAAYCAKVESKIKGNPPQQIVGRDDRSRPLEKQYWYRALNYCGIDANAVHSQYCDTYAKEGGWNGVYGFELNCKPAEVSAFADRQCAGREYTSGNSSSDSAFCARNYKGKLDPRFKKLATKQSKPKYDETWIKACKPLLRPEDVKKGSAKLTVETPTSSSSSSGSSNTTSSPSGSTAPPAPAPAPSGVDDALNKAKKIKDLFNF